MYYTMYVLVYIYTLYNTYNVCMYHCMCVCVYHCVPVCVHGFVPALPCPLAPWAERVFYLPVILLTVYLLY
jgi:hypothetical protein